MKDKTIDEVAETMAGSDPGSKNDQKARAEFYRRQTIAIESTSKHTKKYTLYMLISVVVIALSFMATLIFDYLNYEGNEKYIYYDNTAYILRLDTHNGSQCYISSLQEHQTKRIEEKLNLHACEF